MIHYVSSFNVVGSSRRRAHVLCQASSHHRISSAQRRFIISNLRELFWGGVGTTSADDNPIIDIIEQRQKPSISQETASDLAAPRMYLPKFSSIKPKHMAGAAHYIKDQQVQDLQRTTELVLPMEIPKATDGSIVNESLLDNLIRSVDRIHQSHFALSQIGSLLWSLSCVDMKTKNDWHCSLIEAQSISIDASALSAQILRDHEIHGADGRSKVITLQWNQLHHAIFAALQSPQKGNSQQSNVFAAKILLRKYEYATGILFPPSVATTSGENGPCYSDDDRARKYSELSEILSDVEKSILEIDSAKVSLPTVRLFYSYIGVRTQMAKLLGYSTAADQVFRCRHQVSAVADIDLIKQLHLDVKERLTPMLNSISERRKRPLDLETYLTGAGELTSQANLQNSKYSIQYWKDTKAMLKLEHHVTLKGALQFTFRLMKDLFGVSIAEHDKDDLDVWNENVRLYHVYDELYQHEYMGSFYLDPFQRREKMSQPATMPIFPGCGEYENQRPLVCMSLALELPPWDTSPAMMTWLDCETLLHEMGHVMQFMMSGSHTGCVLGPQSMPLDISEFLPKFMELWLTQKSTIFALIDMSESNTPLSDESVDAMYRVKAREKMMKLAELSFYGSLELELFSGFDLKGPETILDLQGRIFEDFMPHFDNDKSNLTALLDVMQANVHGRHVACYRYLCCEVFAAEVFERFTDAIVSNPQLFPQLRLEMRQHLLEPGAAIDFDGFQSKFGLKGCTLDPLWKLHGIANVLFVAPSES